MINEALINPRSIMVVGGSANTSKPGGKVILNILAGDYKGKIYVVNPKKDFIEGVETFATVDEAPSADLAILAIPAKGCPDVVEILAKEKDVKAFIILSAGFSEETPEGKLLEQKIKATCDTYQAALIGPNCIGILNRYHHSIFTLPIPQYDAQGADLISSSGATIVYILESAFSKGLRFNSIWSVGNAAQISVEDVLQYMDEHFVNEKDSKIKLLYIETIQDPDRLLRHASSLIRKGCRIAAIKSGSSESGARAASSHTGALASSDLAVEALFRKAGIVRCFSREELTTVGALFTLKPIKGNRIAIITHAGGPAVMLTDALSKGGLSVPNLHGAIADELKSKLFPGASTGNPIDILATGTAEQLGICIDYCEHRFKKIDAIAVIFGSPGLVNVFDAYQILDQKIKSSRKPIFPILPSTVTAGEEVKQFLDKGNVNFSDEVTLATAISRIINQPKPTFEGPDLMGTDVPQLRQLIDSITQNGYVSHDMVRKIFACANIPTSPEFISTDVKQIAEQASKWGYPLVAKVVGPLHKTDVNGVVLNIQSEQHLKYECKRLLKIPEATGVLIQPMYKGTELFIGAKYEQDFGHIVMCGLGGIFVEILKDVASGLAPLTMEEALSMIHSIRSYPIIQGARGQKGINEQLFASIIVRLSSLLRFAVEIKELDINPLIGYNDQIVAVDARIRVEKK